MRLVSAVALFLLLGLACSGKSRFEGRDHGSGEPSGGSATGGSATGAGPAEGGASGGTGGTNTGGTPGMACVMPEFHDVCLSSCFVEEGGIFDRICVDGEWACPEGTTFWDDCPPNSCAGVLSHCCSEAGMAMYRDCAADGRREACPSGERPVTFGEVCAPAGVNVEACVELERQPCDSGQFCSQGGTTCLCQADARWECIEPL